MNKFGWVILYSTMTTIVTGMFVVASMAAPPSRAKVEFLIFAGFAILYCMSAMVIELFGELLPRYRRREARQAWKEWMRRGRK